MKASTIARMAFCAIALAACVPPQSPGSNAPSIASFAAAPSTIQSGQTSTLSWSVTGAT